MKKNIWVLLMCFSLGSMAACNSNEVVQRTALLEENSTEDEEAEEASDSEEQEEKDGDDNSDSKEDGKNGEEDDAEVDASAAKYVGEYNSYDIDEPELEIEQQDDGSFKIQIGIFRLIQLYHCVGELTDEGIEFYTTELVDKDIRGIVTLDGDVATVTFTSADWGDYSSRNEHKYYKTSDVPNIYTPSYAIGKENDVDEPENTEDGRDAEISATQYVGAYNSYDVEEPDLQIEQQDDGSFKVQIGIFRLISLDECVGELTDKGLEFYTTEIGDKDIHGIITLDGDVATVTFTSADWRDYSSRDEFKYHKVSDVPDLYIPSY